MAPIPFRAGAHEYTFETFKASFLTDGVLHLEINRPKKLNSLNKTFWKECREIFVQASSDERVGAIILSGGSSKHFTAGLDLTDFELEKADDIGRRALKTRTSLLQMQGAFNAIADCRVPVLALVHGFCVGGGMDMITACDMRWCSQDAQFTIKEVDIGLAADTGTLQRLPRVVGNESWVREIAYTGRKFDASEAASQGLVSRTFANRHDMMNTATEFMAEIAAKSPIAVVGTKRSLEYSRDHSIADGLEHIATWNAAMLQSDDLTGAITAVLSKKKPTFSKL